VKTIWKFAFKITDQVNFHMPAGAEILTVQMQIGEPCLWALVDPEAERETRTIFIRGTGHPADRLGRYISTFQVDGGALIFHAFEQMH
jgi:hypothetical protein